MRLICGPSEFSLASPQKHLRVLLYGQSYVDGTASAGEAIRAEVARKKLAPAAKAWDLVSIGLSLLTADFVGLRHESPDGWTRQFHLDVAVSDPDFWNSQVDQLRAALGFLTTDIWSLEFHAGGSVPATPTSPHFPGENCVVLLSGGLDSLVGAIDLVADGQRPYVVSKTVRGDREKQVEFAAGIGGGLSHLQLNPNVKHSGTREDSQRARSFIFLALGVLIATSLRAAHEGEQVPLYVCENGFIAINPSLTGARLGSLSTRTAHPEFLGRMQNVISAAGMNVVISNPYALSTKGEMLKNCRDQELLSKHASTSTSCGRFQRLGYRQCGRCIPCQVRRASFIACGLEDDTQYIYQNLGTNDADHASFDDVRSMGVAIQLAHQYGLDYWLGNALASPFIGDRSATRDMIGRGLAELRGLHLALNIA